MPQKILTIGSKEILSGISLSPYYGGAGIWDVATGVDFFRYPGLLAAAYGVTDIGSGTVDNRCRYFLPYPGNSSVYVIGTDEHSGAKEGSANNFKIYKVLPDDDSISISHSSSSKTIYGADVFQGEIVYANSNDIGISNTSTTNWYDTGIGGWGSGVLESTTYFHPVKTGPNDKCYIGDVNNLHEWDGTTLTEDKLSLTATYTITALGSDGNYLLIGASQSPYSGRAGFSRLFYWDTWSTLPNKYWPIPENPIREIIQGDDGYTYVFAGKSKYKCKYNESPKIVFDDTITNLTCLPKVDANSVSKWRGMAIWGDSDTNKGWTYGAPNEKLDPVLSNPIIASSSDTAFGIYGAFPNKFYAGFGTKLLAFKTGTASATARTILLTFPKAKITGLKVIMVSAGSVTASVQDRDGNSIISETISDSKHIKKQGSEPVITDQVKVNLSFTDALISEVSLWGIPISE